MEETDGNVDEEVRTGNNKYEDQYTAAGHTQDAHYGICLWTGRIDKHMQERLSVVLEKHLLSIKSWKKLFLYVVD